MLLSANVGLLAIQSVDNQQGAAYRSVAQIASYASVIMSLASYLIGHILSLQHSRELRDNDENAVRHAFRLALRVCLNLVCLTARRGVPDLYRGTDQRKIRSYRHIL